ncbi:MAG: hypothetical protein SGJ00_03555 [bacterium]|nr:hypothetical protein [bacterium]
MPKNFLHIISCLLLLIASVTSSFAKKNHQEKLSSMPLDSPSNYSKYHNKSKMVKFSKYIERPIPLKVWMDTSAYFFFSDTAVTDRFRFYVVGDYEYTATVYFQIITKKKECIFKDSFPLMKLLSIYIEGGGYYATRSQKERAILEYAETLLNQQNIEEALNLLPERLEPDFTLHQNHHLLTTNGAQKFFSYSKQKDSNTFIGFDPLLGYALKFYETVDW